MGWLIANPTYAATAEQQRLDDAACALAHCAEGVPDTDSKKQGLLDQQTRGATYIAELDLLRNTGLFVYKNGRNGEFPIDAFNDYLLSHDQFIHRTGGAVDMGFGAWGVFSGYTLTSAGAATCLPTGVGCFGIPVGTALATSSGYLFGTGYESTFGDYLSPEGQRVIDSFNVETFPGERNRLAELGVTGGIYAVAGVTGKYVIPPAFRWLSAEFDDFVANVRGTSVNFTKVGTPTFTPSSTILSDTTVELTQELKLSNGTVLPKGTIVTTNGNAMSATLPDGTKVIGNVDKLVQSQVQIGYNPTAVPIINQNGANRAAIFSKNWSDASLSEVVQNVAGTNPVITYPPSGKTIYTNPITGLQVVYDNAGNYFTVINPNATGIYRYLDKSGNVIPANVPLFKPGKTSTTGISNDIRKALTHFNNTDTNP